MGDQEESSKSSPTSSSPTETPNRRKRRLYTLVPKADVFSQEIGETATTAKAASPYVSKKVKLTGIKEKEKLETEEKDEIESEGKAKTEDQKTLEAESKENTEAHEKA